MSMDGNQTPSDSAGFTPPPAAPEKKKTNTPLIIAIVVVIVLCCCCIGAIIFYQFLGDPIYEWFKNQFGVLISQLRI